MKKSRQRWRVFRVNSKTVVCERQSNQGSVQVDDQSALWKDQLECRALTHHAVNAQLTAVALHDVLGDGQAQARATGFSGTAAVHPVKTLGQTRQMLGCNAWA
jgi:hypothetical protein